LLRNLSTFTLCSTLILYFVRPVQAGFTLT
jgi:hypothetical protein